MGQVVPPEFLSPARVGRTNSGTTCPTIRMGHLAGACVTAHAKLQIWEALHPVEIQVAQVAPPEIGYKRPPKQDKAFAADTAAIKRRKQIWEALHPDMGGKTFSTHLATDALGRSRSPQQQKAFAADTAAAAFMGCFNTRTQSRPVTPACNPCNPSVLPWGYRGYSTGFERDRLKVEPNVAHQVAACGALFFGLQPATWPATYTTALLQPPMQKGCHF